MNEKTPLTQKDAGIQNISLHERHIYSYYHYLDLICEYIAKTDNSIDGKKIKTMVLFMIATLPDTDQCNRCAQMLDKINREDLQAITKARNHESPSQEDIHDAMISASLITLQLIQQIMNEQYGIIYQNDYGVI